MGIAASANILLNLLLIPRFGIIGAAIATCFGYFTALVILYGISQRLVPIPYQAGKLAIIICSILVVIILTPHIPPEPVGKDLLIRFAILALYGGLLLVTRAVTPDDLALFGNINWIRRKAGNQVGRNLKGLSNER
jgi:O-antigen/teichoic acid export membrane protein